MSPRRPETSGLETLASLAEAGLHSRITAREDFVKSARRVTFVPFRKAVNLSSLSQSASLLQAEAAGFGKAECITKFYRFYAPF